MKYNIVILLLLGYITSTEAVNLQQMNTITLNEVKPAEKQTIQLEKKSDKKADPKKVEEPKPKADANIQVATTENKLVVSIDPVGKNGDEKNNKAQELAAMEEALKKATEEAHKQRVLLSGDGKSLAQSQSKAMLDLKLKQDQEQQQLLKQLEQEEKVRQEELKQNLELESKIATAEKERQQEEILSHKRAEELKQLQAEEAAQKLEAEQKEQEFLAAQAIQETKQAAARKAAAKANLARLKRKHELQRRKAEAQLQMLKVKQQIESENVIELEKNHPGAAMATNPEVPMLSQQKIKADAVAALNAEKEAAEKKKIEESALAAKKAEEQKKKEAAEKAAKEAAEKKAVEEKKKAEEAEKLKKQQEAEMAKKKQKLQGKADKMTQELDSFSVTLNQKHFENALAIRSEIKADGFEEPQVHLNTVQMFKKSFTFPQIANNDYAVEQLESLSIAEQNLNNDVSNTEQMETFIKTANEVAQNLSERYKEQWVDPKDDRQ